MKCPACQSVMFVIEYDDIELDYCQQCRGVWFDRGELDLLLGEDAALRVEPARTEESLRRCPLCRAPMAKMNIGPEGGVMIDVCPDQCGLWFDGGEVGDLARSLRQAGQDLPPDVIEFLRMIFPAGEG